MNNPTIAENLQTAYQTCEADRPLEADDPRWQDFSEGRGDDTTATLTKRFRLRSPDHTLKVAFLSHRGAGKTTELNRLHAALRDSYYRVYFEANAELDPEHLEAEDLLLALALVIERLFREERHPLPERDVKDVERWFAEVVRTTQWGRSLEAEVSASAGADGGIPFFTKLAFEIKGIFKTQSEHREEVRAAFRRTPSALVAAVNRLLDAASTQLAESNRRLLIVIDNLDRYAPQVIDALLLERGALLRELRVDMVLTPPISLLYRPISEALEKHYACEVMNTLRLRRADQPYDAFDGPGRDLMLAALRKRIQLEALIPDARLRDHIVSASGGAIRELLHLVQESILLENGPVLAAPAVEKAIARTLQRTRDRVNANGWARTLARIARNKQIFDDPSCMDVLYHRLALKYDGTGWYDVHPLVARLDEFNAALAAS